ncbi:MAG: sigma 54-interacting transcriptional regulator [Polyangiaceae bacterium]|nr:sigma 54-interacting transcriptional regulator [Polyangiaceae bacterium]
MPHLIVRQPDRVAFSVELREGMTVGRHEPNGIMLDDAKVSRQHASFTSVKGRWSVRDLGSTHGTFVNGARVTTRELSDGDRVQVGQVLLAFVESEARASELVHQKTAAGAPSRDGEEGRKLRVFYDVAHAIGEIEDADALIGRMLEAIIDVLGCERGLVGLRESQGLALRRIVRSRGGGATREVVLSRFLVDATLGRREGVIVRDPSSAHTLLREGILSAMSVPLCVGTRVLGLLYVDDRGAAGRFTEQDLDFLSALGQLTGAALEGAERYQGVVAAVVEALEADSPLGEIVGSSPPMQRLRAEVRKFAAANAHVLVRGESGTGKELVAHTLHALSPRAGQPFVTLNCAAIPEALLEAELFGHEKGAFTGAVREKRGKFVLANRGTLFLDEIGDLGAPAQAKLLRAIQQGEVQPLGSERVTRVDVRILSATHKNLMDEVAAGRFREDLFYRLNVVELDVPPLRERGDDIPLLAQTFLNAAARRMGKPLRGFTMRAIEALRRHRWPGNVRELQNEAERAAIVAEGELVDIRDLNARISGAPRPPAPSAPILPSRTLAERFSELEPLEKALVVEAVEAARGNLSEAARLLGISRVMMKRRVEKFGLSGDELRALRSGHRKFKGSSTVGS